MADLLTALYEIGDVIDQAFHYRGQHNQASHAGKLRGRAYELDGRFPVNKGPIRSGKYEDVDAHVAQLKEKAAEALDGDIKIAVTEAGIKGIIADGRFKTAHEVASSRDKIHAGRPNFHQGYVERRAFYEKNWVGVPNGTPNNAKPVYGYMGSQQVGKSYGEYTVHLKPEMTGTTTVTFGDSLDGKLRPVWIDELPSATDNELDKAASGDITWDYTEAQIHGGVKISDIDFITVAPNGWRKLTPAEKATLAENGIKVVNSKGKEYGDDA